MRIILVFISGLLIYGCRPKGPYNKMQQAKVKPSEAVKQEYADKTKKDRRLWRRLLRRNKRDIRNR